MSKKPLTFNPNDPKSVAEAQTMQRINEEREKGDMLFLLEDIRGRRFLYKLLDTCGLFRTSFSSSGSETFFNEGQRNIALRLFAEVTRADAGAFTKMIVEANQGEKDNG